MIATCFVDLRVQYLPMAGLPEPQALRLSMTARASSGQQASENTTQTPLGENKLHCFYQPTNVQTATGMISLLKGFLPSNGKPRLASSTPASYMGIKA